MTLDEAWRELRRLEGDAPASRHEAGVGALVDGIGGADDAGAARAHGALWVLFEQGDAADRAYALAVWGAALPPTEVADRLVDAYLDGGDAALERFIGQRFGLRLGDAAAARLAAHFAATPAARAELLPRVLATAAADAPVWDVFEEMVAAAPGAAELYGLYGAAGAAARFFAACKGHDEETLRTLGGYLVGQERRDLAAATGVTL